MNECREYSSLIKSFLDNCWYHCFLPARLQQAEKSVFRHWFPSQFMVCMWQCGMPFALQHCKGDRVLMVVECVNCAEWVRKYHEYFVPYIQANSANCMCVTYVSLTTAHLACFCQNISSFSWFFLAELFTTAMFFNWKGARTKSHEKWDFIVILGLWLVN